MGFFHRYNRFQVFAFDRVRVVEPDPTIYTVIFQSGFGPVIHGLILADDPQGNVAIIGKTLSNTTVITRSDIGDAITKGFDATLLTGGDPNIYVTSFHCDNLRSTCQPSYQTKRAIESIASLPVH